MLHATYLAEGVFKGVSGQTFRKQVLRKGVWVHPNDPTKRMEITDTVLSSLVENFKRGVVGKVGVPWTHTDNAAMNTGYVVGLEATAEGLDAILTLTDGKAADKAAKGEIPGVSCGLDFDYLVRDTTVPDVGGRHIGPTLLHVALVNHPYVKGMADFQPITLSEDGQKPEPLVMLNEEDKTMTLTELLVALKTEHNIDVEALKVAAARVPELEAQVKDLTPKATLSEDMAAALGNGVNLSEGGPVAAVKGLVAEVATLRQEKVQAEADKAVSVLLSDGKISPAQKDKFTKLFLSDKAMFTEITADMPKVIDLSEHGTEGGTDTAKADDKTEIERLTAVYHKK